MIGDGDSHGSIAGNMELADGSITQFAHSADVTYGGVLSGAGQVMQRGGGTLTFTGENSNSGTTTVLEGGLRVGDGGTRGSVASATIILGNGEDSTSRLVFDRSDQLSYGGTIQGDGSLTQQGTGTLTLTGANDYTLGTTLSAGTLSVSDDSNLGHADGGLTFNGGTLQVTGSSFGATARGIDWQSGGGGFDIANAADAFTVSQPLSGTGGLAKEGAGTLVLDGTNSYGDF